jgi:polynucleotide 5'-hydroxyl-kinase GRC3/NOL9
VRAGAALVADPTWATAVARAREARVILAIGASDTGKTSLLTCLAGMLLDEGRSVAVVDADLGQSEVGPPTTIGLGRMRGPCARLADAELLALFFVGATSPGADMGPTVAGTRLLTERAVRLGVQHVLVDTSGLVQGEVGRRLKQQKIDAVRPDLVVCLERDGECSHILHRYVGAGRPAVLRLPPAAAARRRSAEERRRHRAQALAAYFRGARAVTLDLERLARAGRPACLAAAHRPPAPAAGPGGSCPVPGEGPLPARLAEGLRGTLVGLHDAAGETVGLGIIRGCDPDAGRLVVETPVPGGTIDGVRLGRPPEANLRSARACPEADGARSP